MLTIGITTCNRMKYTKSLFESLGDEILTVYQVIVVDNGSLELNFKNYLNDMSNKYNFLFIDRDPKDRNWINDEYVAKNLIIENSKHDTILFLQDDQQYLFDKQTLDHYIKCFSNIDIPSLDVNAVRKCTIRDNFLPNRLEIENEEVKDFFWLRRNNHFQTMGFFKKRVFDECGLYPVDWPLKKEYWGRSETWYSKKIHEYNKKYLKHEVVNVKSHVPLFAPVWNDPRGGYAFIRGDQRYGHYLDPVGKTYYKNYNFSEYKNFLKNDKRLPFAYSEIVKPDGWSYNKDEEGDQVKFPQSKTIEDGPFAIVGEE